MKSSIQTHYYHWNQHDRHPYDHFSLVQYFSPIANQKYVLGLLRIQDLDFCHHFSEILNNLLMSTICRCQQFDDDDVNNTILSNTIRSLIFHSSKEISFINEIWICKTYGDQNGKNTKSNFIHFS